jgi:ABC-2 type transport system ATP-binding protein
VIKARRLTKRYGSTLAVDDLSFDVNNGVVTGFLGPNGSGKSTTMRMIMGLDAPNSGNVTVNGRPYHELRWPLREVGALLEARAIHPGRSARDHLWSLAQTNDIPRTRVDDVLEMVGLSAVAKTRAGKFSLGMEQRLGIAAALLGDPAVLLFDEPVNGLDPEGIRWVRNLLRSLAADGRTVFVSSHLMSEMALTADNLVLIGRGRLIAQTSIADFVEQNTTQWVEVRSPTAARLTEELRVHGAEVEIGADGALSVRGMPAAAVGDLAARRGITLHELSPRSASLEEAFMEMTEESVEFRGGTDHKPARHNGPSWPPEPPFVGIEAEDPPWGAVPGAASAAGGSDQPDRR